MLESNSSIPGPPVYPNVFRTIVISTVLLSLISFPVALSVLIPAALTPSLSATVHQIENAQTYYHANTGAYAESTAELTEVNGSPLTFPRGIEADILAVCDSGWVAEAHSNVLGSRLFLSSESSSPVNETRNLKLPACITADDLGQGRIEAPELWVTNVNVVRSLTVGADMGGVKEGASLTWDADTKACSLEDVPVYQVSVSLIAPEFASVPPTETAPVLYLSSETTFEVPEVFNGMSYHIGVSGACSDGYALGEETVEKFAQSLPKSSPVSAVWSWKYSNLTLGWGKVSSSPYVYYEVQLRKKGTDWRMIAYGYNQNNVTVKPVKYWKSNTDEFMVRAYVDAGAITGEWSDISVISK
jgi:hypothetical protein